MTQNKTSGVSFQSETFYWCTGNFPLPKKKLSTGIRETFYLLKVCQQNQVYQHVQGVSIFTTIFSKELASQKSHATRS